MTLTPNQRRDVALFVRDVARRFRADRLRYPTKTETVISAYAVALELVNDEIGNELRYLGAPSPVRSALREVSAPAARSCFHLADVAQNVIDFLGEAGNSSTRDAESVAMDHRILALAAKDFRRAGEISERQLARDVDLHRTCIHDKLVARGERTMQALYEVAPTVWSDRGRPTAGPADFSGKVWTADSLQLAA